MKNTRGFTLIEMLVAVALFSSVMVIALGSLLAISASDRKAQSLKTIINNLNFSVDSMARALRTGTNWNCSGGSAPNCNGGNALDFVPTGGSSHVYYRLVSLTSDPTNAAVICNQTAPNVGCLAKSTDGTTWLPLTSPEVVITDYSASSPASYLFYVFGASQSDTTQPRLVITLSGYVKVSGGVTSQAQCGTAGNQCSAFHLQTSVTQRIYDQ